MQESTSKPGPKLVLTNHDLLDDIPSASTSEYDALAALFLENAALSPNAGKSPSHPKAADSTTTTSNAASPSTIGTTVEGLIVGHLPVLGAAWISQVARQRSQDIGKPVVLARMMDGVLSIDLVAESTINLDHVAECDSLEKALESASKLSNHWIIRVSEPLEIDLARSESLTRLCLLTGADEAAMVASYRTFKGLLQAAQPNDGMSNDVHLCVTIFGADQAKAGESENKLRRAAHTFLGRDLDSATAIQKISTCSMASIFRGKVELSIADLIEHASRVRTPPPAIENAPPPPPAPVESTAKPAADAEVSAAVSTPSSEHSLAAMIEGLRPLAARSPYCPDIELAVDASGALHLVAAHDAEGESGVKNLLATASWAAMHESLLAAAEPQFKPSSDAGAMLHLVCAHAPSVKALLDSGIRVHLLVQIGTLTACRPLN